MLSRRELLKVGTGLSAMALMPRMDLLAATTATSFSTGYPALDQALRGGLRPGTLTVVIGPRSSGKTAFLYRLAKANGVMDATPISRGTCDMLSIMEHNGKPIGHLMSDIEEPWTDQERAAIALDSAAHDAFLFRWFQRTREVLQDSGGIFVFSILGTCDALPTPNWTELPDYIVALDGSSWKALKH
jgi:hypothetical protein